MNKVSTILSWLLKLSGTALLICLCFMAISLKKDADNRAQAEAGLKDATVELKSAAHEISGTVIQLNSLDPKDASCKTSTGCRTAIQEIIDNSAGISRMAYAATKAQQDYWNKFPGKSDALVTKFQGIADSMQSLVSGVNETQS